MGNAQWTFVIFVSSWRPPGCFSAGTDRSERLPVRHIIPAFHEAQPPPSTCPNVCVCVCMCEEKEKFRSGLCSSVSAVDAVWRGCGACVSTDTDPVCCCVAGHREIESIREMKSEGVVRAAYQNLSGYEYKLLVNAAHPVRMEQGREKSESGQTS